MHAARLQTHPLAPLALAWGLGCLNRHFAPELPLLLPAVISVGWWPAQEFPPLRPRGCSSPPAAFETSAGTYPAAFAVKR